MAQRKDFKPIDIARIMRALDLQEFAASMREISIDVSVLEPSEARARILAEAGTRAMFVAFVSSDYAKDAQEFMMERTPAESMTTI